MRIEEEVRCSCAGRPVARVGIRVGLGACGLAIDHVRSRERRDSADVAVSVGAVPEPARSGSAGKADHGGCSESIALDNRELDV